MFYNKEIVKSWFTNLMNYYIKLREQILGR